MTGNRIIFKNFEIRNCGVEEQKHDYEVVRWRDDKCSSTCYTIAFLRFNENECGYEMNTVGSRFFDDYEPGLCEFLSAFLVFATKSIVLRERYEE